MCIFKPYLCRHAYNSAVFAFVWSTVPENRKCSPGEAIEKTLNLVVIVGWETWFEIASVASCSFNARASPGDRCLFGILLNVFASVSSTSNPPGCSIFSSRQNSDDADGLRLRDGRVWVWHWIMSAAYRDKAETSRAVRLDDCYY